MAGWRFTRTDYIPTTHRIAIRQFVAQRRKGWRAYCGLALIVLIAGLLRFWRLNSLPPGLHYDEAFNDIVARRIYRGEIAPAFVPENNGQEPLHMYLVAAVYWLFGLTPIGGRLASAGMGVLAVVALYHAIQELFWYLGPLAAQRFGLLCSLVLATWYWHFHYSRIGMEPAIVPTVALAAVLFVWRAMRTGSRLDSVLAGAFTGLALYTYLAGRAIPGVVGLAILYHIGANRSSSRRALSVALLIGATALVVSLPLGLYFWRNPQWFFSRIGQVTETTVRSSAAGGPGAQLWTGLTKTALGLVWRGDGNWRQNLPGRPAFDSLQSIFFAVGLTACVRRWRRPAHWFVLVWAALGLLPTVLTEYPPHFGRALGATPPLAILVGLGMWRAAEWIGRRSRRRLHQYQHADASRRAGRHAGGRGAAALVVGFSLATSTGLAFRDYFQVWARSPGLFIAFDVGLTEIGRYASRLPANEPVYLTPVPGDLYTLAYFVDDAARLQSYNGRACLVFPARTAAPAHMIIVVQTGEDGRSLDRLTHLFPTGHVVWEVDNWGAPYAVDFRIPGGTTAGASAPRVPVRATVGNRVGLLGYDLSTDSLKPGSAMTVTLMWQGLMPMKADYTVFVHLIGPASREDAAPRVWAQRDARPCDHSYLTGRWQPGDVVWDDYSLMLPADAPAGDYRLTIGMYELATGERLPTYAEFGVGVAGQSPAGDSLTLAHITVGD